MPDIIRIVAFIVITVSCNMASATVRSHAGDAVNRHIAAKFQSLPNDSIVQLGYEYLYHTPAHPDSALWCNAILINKIEGKSSNPDDLKSLVRAYVNTAYVFCAPI